ncbi:MAG TPA: cofactor-independent phosphoglycerate mutase [Methanoregulaceae archaeon]|nr:cofactor-independent phosphoglycerate mutase [Methanoregulaceae archaeon]
MKYIVILGDGMADEPLPELGGKTPLEFARTPHMDRIARDGKCGMMRTIPPGYEPGSDIANLSILGYDPKRYYTGRGPLEAASMGLELTDSDIAYRCNLVTVKDGVMADFSAGHISSGEGARLFKDLQPRLAGSVSLHPGISYRNLLVIHGGMGATTVPPHDIVGQDIGPHLPGGEDAAILTRCIRESIDLFGAHPVNLDRIRSGKPAATQIWPWSGGRAPALPAFREKYRKSGGVISAVDLLAGIARCAGMEVIRVPGATGYLDTDYSAKARYAVSAMGHLDFLYLHVEAPDEAGHLGSIDEKVSAIEHVDEMIGIILDEIEAVIAVLPDHPTPIRVKTHTADPVPFAVLGKEQDACMEFSEKSAMMGGYGCVEATEFLTLLFA